MTELEQLIAREEHDLFLAQHGLHPEQIPHIEARLAKLREQVGEEFREWYKGVKTYQDPTGEPRPEMQLTTNEKLGLEPTGIDETWEQVNERVKRRYDTAI